jgi:hypothetical protein
MTIFGLSLSSATLCSAVKIFQQGGRSAGYLYPKKEKV